MTIKTPNYTIQGCNKFSVKDDGIYNCNTRWITNNGEVKYESLIIPKVIFIEAFNKWCK